MTEKRKGRSRSRPVFIILLLVLILSSAFIYFKFEENIQSWLNDDPFTPICQVPELGLLLDKNLGAAQHELYIYSTIDSTMHLLLEIHSQDIIPFTLYQPITTSAPYIRVQRSNGGALYRVSTAKSELEMLPIERTDHYFTMSPQGSYLVGDPLSGIREIVIYDAATFEFNLRLQTGFIPTWAPNESRIMVFETLNGQHGIPAWVDLSASPEPQLFEGWEPQLIVAGRRNSWAWSPDSRYFTILMKDVETWDDHLWLIDFTDGDKPQVRALLQDITIDYLFWSPNSQMIVMGSQGTVSVFDVNVGHIIWEIDAYEAFRWDLDGLWLQQHVDISDPLRSNVHLVVADVVTNTLIPLTEHEVVKSSIHLDSRNGYIYYETNQDQPYLYDIQHHTLIELPANRGRSAYKLTPDSQYYSYMGDNHWLYLFDLERLRSCRVVELDWLHPVPYHWYIIPEGER